MAGQPTPYLGSKISLISKSEIRYEGILYTVDTKESTIALAKVQSFGTEDRPTEHPVAPRDEIYEYIIFKASDIKDLMVCETPKPVPQLCPGLPYDPAIVSVSQQSTMAPSIATALTAAATPGTGFSPGTKPLGVPSGSSSRSETPHQRSSVSPGGDAGGMASRAPGAGRNLRGQMGQNRRAPGGPPGTRGGMNNMGNRQAPFQQQQQRGGLRQDGGNRQDGGSAPNYRNAVIGGPGRRGEFNRGGFRGGFNGGGGGEHPPFGNRGGWNQGPPRGRGGGGGGGGGAGFQQRPPRSGDAAPQRQPLKFDGDYDFEKANEQFQETLNNLKDEVTTKAKISDGAEEEENKEEKHKDDSGNETAVGDSEEHEHDEEKGFYNKSKSFFDHISCEALERQEGKNTKPNWRKEREQNMETFGQSAIRNYQYRRGGGGRGMGGGGGFRGGAGFRGRGGFGRGGFNNRY